MGNTSCPCINTFPLSIQNTILTDAENKTRFCRLDALSIVTSVCRFSYDVEVGEKALSKAIAVLRVSVPETLLDPLSVGDNVFSMQKFATFGIVNSRSRAQRKLEALWNIYNLEAAKTMSTESVRKIVRVIIQCAVELPLYLLPNHDKRLDNYLNRLRGSVKLFEKQLMTLFESTYDKEIEEADFLCLAKKFTEMNELLNPDLLRRRLEEDMRYIS
jgi:hypothetical protein